jgi:hypothetical protein
LLRLSSGEAHNPEAQPEHGHAKQDLPAGGGQALQPVLHREELRHGLALLLVGGELLCAGDGRGHGGFHFVGQFGGQVHAAFQEEAPVGVQVLGLDAAQLLGFRGVRNEGVEVDAGFLQQSAELGKTGAAQLTVELPKNVALGGLADVAFPFFRGFGGPGGGLAFGLHFAFWY